MSRRYRPQTPFCWFTMLKSFLPSHSLIACGCITETEHPSHISQDLHREMAYVDRVDSWKYRSRQRHCRMSYSNLPPISYSWDKSIGGRCIDDGAFYAYLSLPNVVTDVGMMILPIPMIWKLHSSPSKKFGLFSMFMLGTM